LSRTAKKDGGEEGREEEGEIAVRDSAEALSFF
jgi:hypothetical protein